MNAVAITISNDIPSPELEIVSLALVTRHQALLSIAAIQPAITTPEIAADAERVLVELADVEKQIQAEVDRRSKPAYQLHKTIIAVGNKALEPVQLARTSLRGRIGVWNREQQRLRDEALAKAEAERKAAAEAAEKERQRLQAEADAKHAADVAAAEIVRAAAQKEADARAAAEQAEADREAKELAEVLGAPAEAVKVEAVKIVVEVPAAPVIKVEIPSPPAAIVLPPLMKSSVITKKVIKMEITDEAAIPAYIGKEQIRTIDRAALRRVLDAGVTVQGARLIEVEQDSMRGGGQ